MGRAGSRLHNSIIASEVFDSGHETSANALDAMAQHQRLLSAEIARLRSLSAMGENWATIAHEIRNPLNAISGYAELLGRRCNGSPEIGELADKIGTAARHLTALAQRLLELSRSDALDLRPVEWTRFLTAALDQFEEHSRQRGTKLTLVRRWNENLATGRADALSLRQAIWNVLENAEQACGSECRIEATAHAGADGQLTMLIADRGPGIDTELLPRLFTPFVTTRPQGTGLGLASARKIVEAHGGRITLRNREGGGAEVRIELPEPSAPTLLLDSGGGA